GQDNPDLTSEIYIAQGTGWVDTGQSWTADTTASTNSAVGSYAIQPTAITDQAFLANYDVSYVHGELTVAQASTTTSLSADNNQSVYGQQVTFTATVTANAPGSGTPTGTVTFIEDGTTTLGTGTLSTTGGVTTATFATSTLAVNTTGYSITAVYGGDTNDAGSTSSPLSQTVNQDSTTTSLSADNNQSVYGQQVTFTATVTANAPGSGTPTGTVTFIEDGTTTLGTGTLSTTGGVTTATFATSTLAVNTTGYSITAVYGGDTNDAGSTSSPLSQTVN